MNTLFQRIARSAPNLKENLKEAGLTSKPDEFIKKTLVTSFYMAFGLSLFLFLILSKYGLANKVFIIFPVIFIGLFFYLLKLPNVIKSKKEKEIDMELVFAGRFLVVQLESGVQLYNALSNISKNYHAVGKYFLGIVNKVDIGTNIEDALNETIELVPSKDFRRLLWQILNSIRTGGDISKSLQATLDQINKEQIIKVQEYSRKLNPLAMFYMIVAVIMPSLGISMLIMFSVFINIELNLTILLLLALFIGFVQYMFLAVIKFSRPAVEF